TYDGIDYTAYLNGQLDALESPIIVPNNVAPLRIGFDQTADGGNDFWKGENDEVAFYQKALTSDQIAAHYAAALYGSHSKPVFTEQPQSTMAVAGSLFFFAPVVEGTLPVHLQWGKNGVPLSGETNFFLVFNNLSFGDTGIYELTATNAGGTST